jgi:hypothetical protein
MHTFGKIGTITPRNPLAVDSRVLNSIDRGLRFSMLSWSSLFAGWRQMGLAKARALHPQQICPTEVRFHYHDFQGYRMSCRKDAGQACLQPNRPVN